MRTCSPPRVITEPCSIPQHILLFVSMVIKELIALMSSVELPLGYRNDRHVRIGIDYAPEMRRLSHQGSSQLGWAWEFTVWSSCIRIGVAGHQTDGASPSAFATNVDLCQSLRPPAKQTSCQYQSCRVVLIRSSPTCSLCGRSEMIGDFLCWSSSSPQQPKILNRHP